MILEYTLTTFPKSLMQTKPTQKRTSTKLRAVIEEGPCRYNRLFRQTHKTFQIHHLSLLMFKDYIMILVGTLQRIHRQYVRYESALDNTLLGIEHLNSGNLTYCILDPKILAKYLEVIKDNLEETAPEFELVFTNVC